MAKGRCGRPGCDEPALSHQGYCRAHAVEASLKSVRKNEHRQCTTSGCTNQRGKSSHKCNACSLEKSMRVYQRNKALTDNVKLGAGCMDCGAKNLPAVCYDFDHRPGTDKYKDVSEMVRHAGIARLQAEIGKCDVVCANCHRIRTAERRGKVTP